MTLRSLSDEKANALLPGADHYRAYVGPPMQYDLMGATQFMLLVTLGMREHHRVLDFGCGSLRAGRFIISYLAESNYCGLEPNAWLVDEAFERQLGRDIASLKKPHFFHFDNFEADRCGKDFDFVLAQSIFSHAGPDLMATALRSFNLALSENGLALITVLHPERTGGVEVQRCGWIYPECISYHPWRLDELFRRAGLFGREIPWYHPRQTWYVLCRRAERLPPSSLDAFLTGAIFDEPDWQSSFR